ncbi:MAG: DNA translocase FtsK [Bacteroidales bacterium]|jgi:S-DNA-T family DNA segregation ATPase FtsK/SpoIIIE|nr:DNA translocase FtsK [Bacteroidales bacterium]
MPKTNKKNGKSEDYTKEIKEKSEETPVQLLTKAVKSPQFAKVIGVFLCFFALFCFVSFISFFLHTEKNWGGIIGAFVSKIFIRNIFGVASFGFTYLFVLVGLRIFNIGRKFFWRNVVTALLIMLWVSFATGYIVLVFEQHRIENFAGVVGIMLNKWLIDFINIVGVTFVLIFFTVTLPMLLFNVRYRWFRNLFKRQSKSNVSTDKKEEKQEEYPQITSELENDFGIKLPENVSFDDNVDVFSSDISSKNNKLNEEIEFEIGNIHLETSTITDNIEESNEYIENLQEELEHHSIDEPYDPRADLSNYQFPSLDFLINYEEKNVEVTKEELVENKEKIIDTLKNYSIEITKITATPGPTVTLYEIVPAPGIRISKIKNLEDDIALSLAALGIRIIAPLPGRGTIGIEVPNSKPQIVSMKSMLLSSAFTNNKYELPIAIGKTISSECFVTDLVKMPHLLMAGATGQGKSVGLNAIISSLLYKKHPAELKFVMVDPKKVELSLYSKIEKHYLAKLPDSEDAIITDTHKVVRTLNSLCIEMDQRYDLLKIAQVRKITEYNIKFIARKLNPVDGHRYLPYIVLVIDEFADLIMTAGKEIELPIARLAQLARAVGIHLIIATQRPSVNIITGTIKANFPARIAFKVSSKIDSRTILDQSGAEQLIGRGDMLVTTGNDLVRLQCALIDTEEIECVAKFIGDQRGYPETFLLPEYMDENDAPNKDLDPRAVDNEFEQAARLVVIHQHGSTSLLQRKMSLGYNRAGRIMDQLEAAGIVGPPNGSKARDVKVKTEVELDEILKDCK